MLRTSIFLGHDYEMKYAFRDEGRTLSPLVPPNLAKKTHRTEIKDYISLLIFKMKIAFIIEAKYHQI